MENNVALNLRLCLKQKTLLNHDIKSSPSGYGYCQEPLYLRKTKQIPHVDSAILLKFSAQE